jgi:hypothetical protein
MSVFLRLRAQRLPIRLAQPQDFFKHRIILECPHVFAPPLAPRNGPAIHLFLQTPHGFFYGVQALFEIRTYRLCLVVCGLPSVNRRAIPRDVILSVLPLGLNPISFRISIG